MRNKCILVFTALFSLCIYTQAAENSTKKKSWPKSIRENLVNKKGEWVKKATLNKQEYVLVYFSAHWCPPCRGFTPKLVSFYNQYKKDDNFEVVFVSSDNSEKDQLKYMREAKMPWPALRYKKIKKSKIKSLAGKGIPCLVLLDKNLEVISDSYVNGKYVGPTKVMNDLKAKLLKKVYDNELKSDKWSPMLLQNLVDKSGKKAKKHNIPEKDYVLVYFSAHWCPPCRGFTPKLVDYYKNNDGGNKFEVVFASFDHSEKDQLEYMKEMKMPWLATKFGSPADGVLKKRYASRGIPCVVLLDKNMNALSIVEGKHMGKDKVLEMLREKLDKN